jgi:anti-sigma B factor antagonist
VAQQKLSIEVVTEGQALVVVLKGEADIEGAALMERQLLAVAARKPSKLVLDLSGVTMISSIAMGVLVQLRHGIRAQGGDVVLAGAGGIVLDSLKRAQLDRVFTLLPSTDDALRSS